MPHRQGAPISNALEPSADPDARPSPRLTFRALCPVHRPQPNQFAFRKGHVRTRPRCSVQRATNWLCVPPAGHEQQLLRSSTCLHCKYFPEWAFAVVLYDLEPKCGLMVIGLEHACEFWRNTSLPAGNRLILTNCTSSILEDFEGCDFLEPQTRSGELTCN